MKRLNAKVLVKLAAVGLVVLAALALGRDVTLAYGSGSRWLTAELTLQNANVLNSAKTVLAFEPADRCGDDCCAGVGDECSVHPCCPCCSGHGPSGSGGVLAPEARGLIAPPLSRNRIMTGRVTAIAGVTRPPEEPTAAPYLINRPRTADVRLAARLRRDATPAPACCMGASARRESPFESQLLSSRHSPSGRSAGAKTLKRKNIVMTKINRFAIPAFALAAALSIGSAIGLAQTNDGPRAIGPRPIGPRPRDVSGRRWVPA